MFKSLKHSNNYYNKNLKISLIIIIMLFLYFFTLFLFANNNIFKKYHLNKTLIKKNNNYKDLEIELELLKTKINSIKTNNIDKDLLFEYSYKIIHMTNKENYLLQ